LAIVPLEDAIAAVMRLGAATEAMGALAARLRADTEGIALDAAIEASLDGVVEALGIDLTQLTADERSIVAGLSRAFVLLAADLVADPGRPPGWVVEDPGVMLSFGRLSAVMAAVIAHVAPMLDGLAEALQREGALICDVGCGVAGLSVAFCRTWPAARVVGLDPWPPAIALAREQVAAAGVADRVELREIGVEALDDAGAFDLAWFAAPFVPPALLPAGLARVHAALKPGAWLVFGQFAGPPDPVASAAQKVRVVRSGGFASSADELVAMLETAGFADVRAIERTWQAPMAMLVGRRDAGAHDLGP
jgi:predicted O-methyltransferase YrrM